MTVWARYRANVGKCNPHPWYLDDGSHAKLGGRSDLLGSSGTLLRACVRAPASTATGVDTWGEVTPWIFARLVTRFQGGLARGFKISTDHALPPISFLHVSFSFSTTATSGRQHHPRLHPHLLPLGDPTRRVRRLLHLLELSEAPPASFSSSSCSPRSPCARHCHDNRRPAVRRIPWL